jgi:uncharacterized membrane protein YphA (DoxX/SURF4 family)
MLSQLRRTDKNRLPAVVRVFLGVIFFLAGILKVVVPSLGEAFSGQLIAAEIPLYEVSLYTVPVVEMVIGLMLLFGLHARLSAAVAAMIMIVATYVHIVADDPSLFPLQPIEPIGPLMLLLMLAYVFWKGGGAWSVDRRETSQE